MNYLFVLGRNIQLSQAEVFSWLMKQGKQIIDFDLSSNGLLVETEEIDCKKAIAQLGGTIAIGKVLFSGALSTIKTKIKKEEIYLEQPIKFNYSVLDFAGEEFYDILSLLKDKFRAEKLKARYSGAKGMIKMQDGSFIFGTPGKLKDISYFLFAGKKHYFGRIEAVYDSKESEKRDMGKPVRRESLAISPRLARILINLSQVREGQTLLDPFCGIGVILQEALLQNINVIGADIDFNASENAKRNVAWLEQNYPIKAKYKIMNADSKKLRIEAVNGIACEPNLGIIRDKTPNIESAGKTIRNFERLMSSILSNLKNCLSFKAKVAFTAPCIRTQKGRIGCNIQNIIEACGLKPVEIPAVHFPIQEFREGQIVGREIYVLER